MGSSKNGPSSVRTWTAAVRICSSCLTEQCVTNRGATPLFGPDRVESSAPRLSGGNICVCATEPRLFCHGAIGALQPRCSRPSLSVTLRAKSETETQRRGRQAKSLCRIRLQRERERGGESGFLRFDKSPNGRPEISLILWITQQPCAFQACNF